MKENKIKITIDGERIVTTIEELIRIGKEKGLTNVFEIVVAQRGAVSNRKQSLATTSN